MWCWVLFCCACMQVRLHGIWSAARREPTHLPLASQRPPAPCSASTAPTHPPIPLAQVGARRPRDQFPAPPRLLPTGHCRLTGQAGAAAAPGQGSRHRLTGVLARQHVCTVVVQLALHTASSLPCFPCCCSPCCCLLSLSPACRFHDPRASIVCVIFPTLVSGNNNAIEPQIGLSWFCPAGCEECAAGTFAPLLLPLQLPHTCSSLLILLLLALHRPGCRRLAALLSLVACTA